LRTFLNPLRTLRLNPNYFNRKGRKDYAKDAKNLFLEVPLTKAGMERSEMTVVRRFLNDTDYVSHKGTKDTKGFMGIRDSLCSLCLCVLCRNIASLRLKKS